MRGTFVFSDPVLDAFIDYGDLSIVRGRLLELLGSCTEAGSSQAGVRDQIITCGLPDEQRNSGNLLFTLQVQ